MFDAVLDSLTRMPILARFALGLMLILVLPPLCQRIRIPAVVGLIAAGVVIGPKGLHIAQEHSDVAHFLGEIGKLLLMFFAGLEIDLTQFQRVRNRSLVYGLASFGTPLIFGIALGRLFGYEWLSSLLIGSVFASHTLLGYPIVQRLKIVNDEAVTVTIGATIFTDIAALLVVAICIPTHMAGFSVSAFSMQVLALAIYVPTVLFGLSRATDFLIKRFHASKDGQFLIMLMVVAIAAVGAEAIHLEGIIGAFLAGLAVNRAVQHSEAREQLEFIGNALFIPVFFMTVGYLIDIHVFGNTIAQNLGLACGIVGVPIAAKFIASVLTQKGFGYSRDQGLVMWALSLPQVAATLAVALTAYRVQNTAGQRLLDEAGLNCVLVLVVVTSTLGPILTERYGRRIASRAA